ncbi:RHS repeat-associated core domain-containing protein [Pseudomonas fontis]|uniref:RHS repeat-associated core domain-containing protein n=1 Tax=Pseudomonas fontis TaxID=2942633 RepID=A0ABT5NWJ8_9PSED|nr:RHS repeat-associated core domain-containing protein [Pseudomonas fontis]MDD0975904.1 RHS repeat-associated core domain-containing protein [Pseudomonas fontis]MDD0992566.1 RHS repeat-associated core domain-containing protein [Pseudomonas fontis]
MLAVLERDERNNQRMLITCNQQRSVLHGVDDSGSTSRVYTAYGQSDEVHGPLACLGFNGEQPDPITGHYLLGNYRVYNPVLMRFHSPDNLSPFAAGGLNSYAYCKGDPINFSDPTGHSPSLIEKIVKAIFEKPKLVEFLEHEIKRGNLVLAPVGAISDTAMPIASTHQWTARTGVKNISNTPLGKKRGAQLTEGKISAKKSRVENPINHNNGETGNLYTQPIIEYKFDLGPGASIPRASGPTRSLNYPNEVNSIQFNRAIDVINNNIRTTY